MHINPLHMNEVGEAIANSIIPIIPGTSVENEHLESVLADNAQELADLILNHMEVRAGRVFEQDGELVIESLGEDSETLRKDSELDRYIVRLDFIVARDTRMHYVIRDAEQKIGEQLKLW